MIVRSMSEELKYTMKKIIEKYKIENLKEPLLSQTNVAYVLWRIKGFIWNSIGKEISSEYHCDLAKFIDQLFDELPSLSDTWMEGIESFNTECLQYINDKKVISMIIDMLILRSIYYQLQKPY